MGKVVVKTCFGLFVAATVFACSFQPAQIRSTTTTTKGESNRYSLNPAFENYSSAIGFGSGATGGAGAPVYIVENLNDSGEGSLRDALENPNPLYVTFRDGLNGVIELSQDIMMKSNKTVDARGHGITLSPANRRAPITPISIADQSNIIIFNLGFDGKVGNWDKDGEGGDGINIKNSSRIWIHRCSFRRVVDGGIDIRPGAAGGISSDISISASRFEDIYQALNLTVNRLTFAYNYCLRVRNRCVKIISGKAHSFNNVIEDWGGLAIQNAKEGGKLLSEGNIFIPGKFKEINKEENGKIEMLDNLYLGGAKAATNSSVGKENANGVVRCGNNNGCWDTLKSDIRGNSGTSTAAPAQPQGQPQAQAQPQAQSQPQVQSQPQAQSQPQTQSQVSVLKWMFATKCEQKNDNGNCNCTFSKDLPKCPVPGEPNGQACSKRDELCVNDGRCKKFRCE